MAEPATGCYLKAAPCGGHQPFFITLQKKKKNQKKKDNKKYTISYTATIKKIFLNVYRLSKRAFHIKGNISKPNLKKNKTAKTNWQICN